MKENISPQTPLGADRANAYASPLTVVAPFRSSPLEPSPWVGRLSEPQLRGGAQFEWPSRSAPHSVPARRSQSCSALAGPRSPFAAGPSLFDVRVMGVDASAKSQVRWYVVRLVCRQRPGSAWQVTRRFSEFDLLARQLRLCEPAVPPLPRKVPPLLLGPTEQQRRVVGLQRFAEGVLSNPPLLSLREVAKFFDLDFGLWHAIEAAPMPSLDRAQERAARMLQSEARRWRSAVAHARARDAASCLQRHWRRRRTLAAPLPGLAEVIFSPALPLRDRSDRGGTQIISSLYRCALPMPRLPMKASAACS